MFVDSVPKLGWVSLWVCDFDRVLKVKPINPRKIWKL